MRPLLSHILITTFTLLITTSYAASSKGRLWRGARVVSVDENQMVLEANPIVVVGGVNMRKYWRLVRSVKRVYPIAQSARTRLQTMEQELLEASNDRERRAIVKRVYKEIKEEYTPVLLKMTITDGRVLIRLIDRETDHTAFNLLKDFKGGLSASFWQGVGRIFGHNLKSEYGSSDEDQIIEMIIKYYERGLI